MAIQLADLVDPAHTVLVTQELQGGVVGPDSALPQLAEAAAHSAVPNAARLCHAARAVGIPVVHCVAIRRPDGLGANRNARLFAGVTRSPVQLTPGTPATRVVPQLGPEPSDLVLERIHGLGPMGGTELDPILRNLGVTTVVGVGVSVNVGMLDFCMDAVNAGYQFVMPRDAVAGVPADYAQAVLDNTFALLATLPATDDVLAVWERAGA